MKLTKNKLKEIIREEVQKLNEADYDNTEEIMQDWQKEAEKNIKKAADANKRLFKKYSKMKDWPESSEYKNFQEAFDMWFDGEDYEDTAEWVYGNK